MNDEIKRIIIDRGHFTEADNEFKIDPNFSTLGSIIEITDPESAISFKPSDSIGSLLGFNKRIIYEEYNLSDNPVDILSFDNIFLECNNAQGMIFRGKRSGLIHNFVMDVSPGYRYIEKFHRYIEKFRGGVQ